MWLYPVLFLLLAYKYAFRIYFLFHLTVFAVDVDWRLRHSILICDFIFGPFCSRSPSTEPQEVDFAKFHNWLCVANVFNNPAYVTGMALQLQFNKNIPFQTKVGFIAVTPYV